MEEETECDLRKKNLICISQTLHVPDVSINRKTKQNLKTLKEIAINMIKGFRELTS